MAGARQRSSQPAFLDPPATLLRTNPDLYYWLREWKLQVERYAIENKFFAPDTRVIGRTVRQELADGFIIEPDEIFVEIRSGGGAIASDVTAAIRDGKLGQVLIIQNIHTEVITIRNNAKTKLAGAVNAVLGQYDTLVLRWDDNNSQWVQWGGSDN